MSVNNADDGHLAHWWADANPTLQAIYFDGDEHPRVATLGAPFVLYIVRRDGPSAVGGIGRVTGPSRRNARGQWETEVPCVLEMICPADELVRCCPNVGLTARHVALPAG